MYGKMEAGSQTSLHAWHCDSISPTMEYYGWPDTEPMEDAIADRFMRAQASSHGGSGRSAYGRIFQ